jgi:hypothetical protein
VLLSFVFVPSRYVLNRKKNETEIGTSASDL